MALQLDHYVQRPVTENRTNPDGWQIILEGDVAFINNDETLSQPDVQPGVALLAVADNGDNYVLQFGNTDANGTVVNQSLVTLTKEKYQIYDPASGEEPMNPEIDYLDPEPMEEPTDRVVEGPTS